MADHPDTRRLRYLMDDYLVDSFDGLSKDRYDYAFDEAKKQARDKPNEQDELN